MPFGILDTKYLDMPANIDAAYVQGLRTRAGVDFPTILRDLDGRLGAFNAGVDALMAMLMTVTTEPSADDSAPVAFEVQRRAEYTPARPQLAEPTAHPLPLWGVDESIGFTEDGLEAMSRNRINLQVESMLAGLRARHRKDALNRLFSDAEERVDPKTTTTSPGFAGSGTGLNAFVRPYPDGTALPGGYTHYYAANTSTGGALRATLVSAVDRLMKWHRPPFDLIAPQALIDLIVALGSPDYVPAGSPLVRLGDATAEALVDPNLYIGVLLGRVRVQVAITDTTASNIAIFKSYGDLDPRNPLAWRYDELKGRDAVIRSRSLYPLDQATVKQDYGVGVNNRVGAALITAAAGATVYVAPTDLT